jgi:hypothetical protein
LKPRFRGPRRSHAAGPLAPTAPALLMGPPFPHPEGLASMRKDGAPCRTRETSGK